MAGTEVGLSNEQRIFSLHRTNQTVASGCGGEVSVSTLPFAGLESHRGTLLGAEGFAKQNWPLCAGTPDRSFGSISRSDGVGSVYYIPVLSMIARSDGESYEVIYVLRA